MKAMRSILLAALAAAFIPGLAAQGTEAGAGKNDPFRFSFGLDLDYEYRLRSAELLVEEAKIKSGIDLTRNVLEMPPLAAMDLELGRERGVGIGFAAEARRQFRGDYFLDSNLAGLDFENPAITKGALYWRSESLDLSLGRDQVDLGEGLEGSLYPSLRLPYLDAFRAKARLGRVGMDWLVASIRAVPSWEVDSYGDASYDIDPNEGLSSEDFPTSVANEDEPYGFQDDANPTTVIEALHRFTWDFGKLRIGVAEHIMYARRNNYFTLTDFLPVISWHQTTIMSNNMSMLADFEWRPLPGLRVMGMGGLDEVDARDVGVNDSGSPTVAAWVLGAEYEGRIGAGPVRAYAEGGYTHYLWGNFDGSNDTPGDVDPLERAQYRLFMDAGAGLLPLTSPYGPGSLWGRLDGRVELESLGLRVGLELLALSKIKSANLVDTSVFDPLADDSRLLFLEAKLPLRWRYRGFEAHASPELLWRDGEAWTELSLGAAYRLRLER